MAKRDIYIAIMVAEAKGQGIHMSAEEVEALARDSAIGTAALNALEEKEWPGAIYDAHPEWAKVNPYRKRVPANLSCGNDDATSQDMAKDRP